MDFMELVQSARSCRRFAGCEPLPEGALEWMVDCARQAPSAGNKQPLRYAVAYRPEIRERLYPALKWAAALPDWDGPEPSERPTGYIAVLSGNGDSSLITRVDLGIAGQTLQLAASSRGLACCMFLSFNPHTVAEVLGLSAEWQVSLMLAVGKPAEVRRIAPMPGPGSVHGGAPYWRDAAGVHHVPKRSLSEVLLVKAD